jgi:hypothetical protein
MAAPVALREFKKSMRNFSPPDLRFLRKPANACQYLSFRLRI